MILARDTQPLDAVVRPDLTTDRGTVQNFQGSGKSVAITGSTP
jgi:hypothetical protein